MSTTALHNAQAFAQLISWRNDLSDQLLADVDYGNGFSFEDGDVAFVDCDCADEDFLPGRWTHETDDGKYSFELVANVHPKHREFAVLQYKIEMTERA